jgi:hypothetical protein
MASSTPHTIAIQGGDVRRELQAAAAITPGHLLEIASGKVQKHSGAAGVLPGVLVALEDPCAVAGTTEAIAVDYDTNDTVYFAQGEPGDLFYMLLKNGETVVTGVTQLQSAGDGTLQAVSVGAGTLEKSVVGVAESSLTASGATRIYVRIT